MHSLKAIGRNANLITPIWIHAYKNNNLATIPATSF